MKLKYSARKKAQCSFIKKDGTRCGKRGHARIDSRAWCTKHEVGALINAIRKEQARAARHWESEE